MSRESRVTGHGSWFMVYGSNVGTDLCVCPGKFKIKSSSFSINSGRYRSKKSAYFVRSDPSFRLLRMPCLCKFFLKLWLC